MNTYHTSDVVPIPEKSTPPLTIGPLRDENLAIVPGSALFTCTLALFNRGTEAIVNGRTALDVKSLVSEGGILVWAPTVLDTAILDLAERQEWRIARIDYAWASGAKAWSHEHTFCVANLANKT